MRVCRISRTQCQQHSTEINDPQFIFQRVPGELDLILATPPISSPPPPIILPSPPPLPQHKPKRHVQADITNGAWRVMIYNHHQSTNPEKHDAKLSTRSGASPHEYSVCVHAGLLMYTSSVSVYMQIVFHVYSDKTCVLIPKFACALSSMKTDGRPLNSVNSISISDESSH